VSFALNEVCVFLNLALSHFNNCGLSAISGVFSRAVCKYKFKAICCSFNSTPSETFDKIVFLGRHFAAPSDLLDAAGSHLSF
jgi:hypothetical protein